MREVNPSPGAPNLEDRVMTHDLYTLRRAYEAQSTTCDEVLHSLRALTIDAGERAVAISEDFTSAFEAPRAAARLSPSVPFTLPLRG